MALSELDHEIEPEILAEYLIPVAPFILPPRRVYNTADDYAEPKRIIQASSPNPFPVDEIPRDARAVKPLAPAIARYGNYLREVAQANPYVIPFQKELRLYNAAELHQEDYRELLEKLRKLGCQVPRREEHVLPFGVAWLGHMLDRPVSMKLIHVLDAMVNLNEAFGDSASGRCTMEQLEILRDRKYITDGKVIQALRKTPLVVANAGRIIGFHPQLK